MDIFIDLEKTLLNNENKLDLEGLDLLKEITKDNELFIITSASIWQARKNIPLSNINIISTLENICVAKNKIITEYLDSNIINKALKLDGVYTAYTISDETLIYNFQERLLNFYPNKYIKIVDTFPNNITFVVLAISLEYLQLVSDILSDYTCEIIAKDKKRVVYKITKTPSTKEYWTLKLKKSQAIGIGDSIDDYSFIKYCDIQVAMKDSNELKKYCKYETPLSNNENGALKFILDYLKHQTF